MTVDTVTVDLAAGKLSAAEARNLTDRIRGGLSVAYDGLVEAWEGRADQALGYDSWDAYCGSEFTEGRMVRLDREQRREIVGTMRSAGMSTRAISAGLGVPQSTIDRDVRSSDPNGSVGQVTSLDGRTRPSTRPPASQPPAAPPAPEVDLDHEFWDETAAKLTADGTVARWDAERPYGLAVVGLGHAADEITRTPFPPDDLGAAVPPHVRPYLDQIRAAHAWLGAFLSASNGASS